MTRTLKQVKFTSEVWGGLRAQAKQRKIQYKQHQENGLRWFFERRENCTDWRPYFASPDAGDYQSLWLDTTVCESAERVAKLDGVSVNRVIYTALCLYWRHLCECDPSDLDTSLAATQAITV